jgi:hypothetical protein
MSAWASACASLAGILAALEPSPALSILMTAAKGRLASLGVVGQFE